MTEHTSFVDVSVKDHTSFVNVSVKEPTSFVDKYQRLQPGPQLQKFLVSNTIYCHHPTLEYVKQLLKCENAKAQETFEY